MTHSNDHFQVDVLDLAYQVVQLGFAFWLQNRLVEVKERIGSVGHLAGYRRLEVLPGALVRVQALEQHANWSGSGSRRCNIGSGFLPERRNVAPSQPGAAVAGVHMPLHRASIQAGSVFPDVAGSALPVVDFWAPAAVASAAVASRIATLFS